MGPERLLLIKCSAIDMARTRTKIDAALGGGSYESALHGYGEGRIHRGVIRGESDATPKTFICLHWIDKEY